MRSGRVLVAAVMVVAGCGVLPAGAGAAERIGMTMFPTLDTDPSEQSNPYNCLKGEAPMADTATLIQFQRQAGSTPPYTVPAGGGVITSWAHMGSDPVGFAETAALQMLRPVSGTQFMVIGQSAVETISNGPNSFSTRIPVKAGDVLGLYVQHGGNVAYCQEQAPMFNDGDKTREIDFTQNPAVGTTLDFAGNEQAARLDVSAVVEPDADGDALGDESQDNCVGSGSACSPDGDNDSAPDSLDNCPAAANPTQSDTDQDGIGDACDPVDNRPTGGGQSVPDTTKPTVVLLPLTPAKPSAAAKGLSTLYACSEAAKLTVTATLDTKTAKKLKIKPLLATFTRSLPNASVGTAKIKPSKKIAKALRRARKGTITLSAAAVDAAGNKGAATAKLKLKR